MTRRRALTIIICTLIVVLIPVGGWLYLFIPLHHEPPLVLGEEIDSSGKLARRIVFERTYRTTGYLPGADGGHETRISYSHFFLEEPGKPRRELRFLPAVFPDSIIIAGLCHPVANSPLWVAAAHFEYGDRINIIVFDDKRVLRQRTISIDDKDMNPSMKDFWFESGNRTLRYRLFNRAGSYDVTSDAISPAPK